MQTSIRTPASIALAAALLAVLAVLAMPRAARAQIGAGIT